MTDSTYIIEIAMPCGHTLRTTMLIDGLVDEKHLVHAHEQAGAVLGHWTQVKLPRHRCALVSEDNPNGILRETTQ